MGVSSIGVDAAWLWESPEPPLLTPAQETMLDVTVDEIRASPLSSAITSGGRSAVWRYLDAAQWRLEPTRGKRVSSFFLDTLEWRKSRGVNTVLEADYAAREMLSEAASGKLFTRGACLRKRPLIWLHLGRETYVGDPELNIRLLIYTVERAIASMRPDAFGPDGKGQFSVVIDCTFAGAGPLPSLSFARQAVSMLMLRYPSRLGKLFLVNSGAAVYFLWSAVSMLLAPATREKIVVVSGTEDQQRELLLQHISPEALAGGRLGCPGAPAFDAESYLAGGDGETVDSRRGETLEESAM